MEYSIIERNRLKEPHSSEQDQNVLYTSRAHYFVKFIYANNCIETDFKWGGAETNSGHLQPLSNGVDLGRPQAKFNPLA